MRGLIYPGDSQLPIEQLCPDEEFQRLAWVQSKVGGHVQWLPMGNDASLFVNEDGKILGLRPNRFASEMCWLRSMIHDGDYIAGAAVVLGRRGSHDASVPPDLLEILLAAAVL